jgi:hypothetical protein
MKLVHNWRRCARMFSVQAFAAIGALQASLVAFPAERLLQPVPVVSAWQISAGMTWGDLSFALTILLAVLGALGRLVDQGQITEPKQ